MKRLLSIVLVMGMYLLLCACSSQCKEHIYSDWSVTTPASCTAIGIETRKCANCEASEEREIVVTAHTYGKWTIKNAATCSADGVEYRQCVNCDAIEERKAKATGHDYSEWVIKNAATCSTDGVEYRQCVNCDAIEERKVKAIGHDYSEWTIKNAATCSAVGTEYRQCANCEVTEERELKATGHTYSGLSCTYCGASRVLMHELGNSYKDKNGLTVTLHSYTVTEEDGYYRYSINYTIANDVPDSKLMPGSFKLFFTDETGEPEYGAFNYLYYGEKSNRSYSWKVLKSQEVLVLEYNADEEDAGLESAFFRTAPIYDALHWSTPSF